MSRLHQRRMSDSVLSASHGIGDSFRRLISTLIEVVHTRVEILLLELDEEKDNLLKIGFLSIASLFFCGLGLIMLTLLVVVALWDSHRIAVLFVFTLLYSSGTAIAALMLRRRLREQPPFLATTLSELSKDKEIIERYDEDSFRKI